MAYQIPNKYSGDLVMKYLQKLLVTGIAFLTALALSGSVLAKGAELKFDSRIVATTIADSNIGTVTVEFTDFEVTLNVNGDTEITSNGGDITLEELEAGDAVRVNAFFSDEGTTAEEIIMLDALGEEFRLHGEITAIVSGVAVPNGAGELHTQISLLGVEAYINSDTRITDLNSSSETDLLATDLEVGDLVDVHGIYNDVLFAERVDVGTMQVGHFEIDGTINAVYPDDTIELMLEDGGTITLLLTDSSLVTGELAAGAFVEVEGMLNADLQIEVFELVVDTDDDGDADDDHERQVHTGPDVIGNPNSMTVSAQLAPVDGDATATGNVSVSIAPNGQEISLQISGASADIEHAVHVLVAGVATEIATVVADADGNVDVTLTSDGNAPASLLLPAGTSLSDLTDVEVSVDGAVVLSGVLG